VERGEAVQKGSPSTGSGRAGEAGGAAGAGNKKKRARAGKVPRLTGDQRIRGGRNREAVIVRNPRRKLFNRARKTRFLSFFAATGNLGWAAEHADICRQTVSRHLMNDAEFAAAYEQALEVSRLRLKAALVEIKKPEAPIVIDGDVEVPDIDLPFDKAIAVLREFEREVKLGRKSGRAPRVATNVEVVKDLTRAVKAQWRMVERRYGRDGSAPPPGAEQRPGAEQGA